MSGDPSRRAADDNRATPSPTDSAAGTGSRGEPVDSGSPSAPRREAGRGADGDVHPEAMEHGGRADDGAAGAAAAADTEEGADINKGANTNEGAEGAAGSNEVAELVGRLSGDERMDRRTRAQLLRRLAARLSRAPDGRDGAPGAAGGGERAGRIRTALSDHGRWLADVLLQVAPRIPIRDLTTLQDHHKGLTGERLADALIRNAGRATAAVGAGGGALAAVQFVAPPLLLTAPAQLTAETLAVAAIEVKLIAELHEVYGVQIPGGLPTRAKVFVGAWARQRGVDPMRPGSVTIALGVAAKAGLRKRLLSTLGRHLTTLGPFLTGAIAGGALNRAATKRLAEAVRADLRATVRPPVRVAPGRELAPPE